MKNSKRKKCGERALRYVEKMRGGKAHPASPENAGAGERIPLKRIRGERIALRFVRGSMRGEWCVAFTLAEVVIGVAILSIVLIGITTLTITSIRANEANIHRLTAYYLAQEGLEGIRTIRDSNWLQNYTWNEGDSLWGTSFDDEGYYLIDYATESTVEPFKLTWLGTDEATALDPDLIQLYLAGNDTSHFYVHSVDASLTDSETSPYKRYLHVTYPNASEDIAEVTAVVLWDEHGRGKSMKVSTRLSDWKEGPL